MKRYLLLVLALLTLVTFGGVAQTTLNVLYYGDATQAGYQEDIDMFNQFQADNPDITLAMEVLFSQQYHQKLSAEIAAGQLPDVVYLWPSARDSSLLIHQQKLAMDLKVLLGADFLKDFAPSALDVNQQASKMLAELPQSFTYTTSVYTNKKLLADAGLKVPTTYAEMKAMVNKLRAKNVQTLLLPDGDQWPAQSCLFSTITGRLLGDKWTANFNIDANGAVPKTTAKFTDANFVAALQFYADMYKDGVINWQNVQMGYGDGPGLFAAGRAAMFVDGDWRGGAYMTDSTTGKALIEPAKQASDFTFINFPKIPGEKFPGTASGIAGTGLAITTAVKRDADVQAAAVKLLKFYYGEDWQRLKLETGAYIPTRKGVTSDKLEPFVTMMADYKNSIPTSTYVLDGVWDPSVFNTLNAGLQALGLGAKTAKQVAAEMQAAQDKLKKQ